MKLLLVVLACIGLALACVAVTLARGPVEQPAGLITVHEYGQEIMPVLMQREVLTNIACEKCGAAVWKDLTMVLTSYPCQYRIYCKKCGWTGYCH